jgi:hypothetical protein
VSASKSFVALSSILRLEPGLFRYAKLAQEGLSLAPSLTEERLTPKVRAASLFVVPPLRASTIFFLRSSE